MNLNLVMSRQFLLFQLWLFSKVTNVHKGLLVQTIEFHLEKITEIYLQI